MANIGEINVGMSLDAEDFGAGLDFARSNIRTFASDLDKVGRLAGGFLAGLSVYKVGGFLVDFAKDAASVEEQVGGLDVVFGSFADDVEAFARATGNKFNVSINEMLDSANRLGAVFQSAGVDDSIVAEHSKAVEALALDYSRLKNVGLSESLDKFISGLSGEIEPLRAFGIFIDDDAVKAKAFQMGLEGVNGKLDQGQKIMARYSLIMDQGALGMGTAAREASGVAARIDGLSGAWSNLRVAVGETFAPEMGTVFASLTDVVNEAREFFEWLDSKIHDKSSLTHGVSDVIAGAGGTLAKALDLQVAVKAPALPDFGDALKLKPILNDADWRAMLNPVTEKPRSSERFSAAMEFGSSEWASTVLRSRFGDTGRNPVADNTKETANNTAKIIAGISVMTGKLEALKSEAAPDWR